MNEQCDHASAHVRTSLILERPALVSRLARSLQRGVAVVSAPTGFGKSVLAQSAAAIYGTVATVNVTSADILSVAGAFTRALAPGQLPALATLSQEREKPSFVDLLASWLSQQIDVDVVVVDNVERVGADESALALLDTLVTTTHGRTRWVFATQRARDLPIRQWVAEGLMSRPLLRADLVFSASEVQRFAEAVLPTPPPTAGAAILEVTNGWPMAVPIAVDLLARNLPLEAVTLRTQHALAAYLRHALTTQETTERDALITCALIGRSTPAALTVAGVQPKTIERLLETFPFISSVTGDIELHSLVIDHIEAVFPLQRIDAIADAVAERFLAHGSPDKALYVALRRGRIDMLERLVDEAFYELCRAYALAPEVGAAIDVLERNGSCRESIAALRGLVSKERGEFSIAFELLKEGAASAPARWAHECLRHLISIAVVRHEDAVAVHYAEQLRDASTPPDPLWLLATAQLIALKKAGVADAEANRQALHDIARELAAVERRMRCIIASMAAIGASTIGEMDLADRFSEIAIIASREAGDPIELSSAYNMRYVVALKRDLHLRDAAHWGALALEAAQKVAIPSIVAIQLHNLILPAISRGKLDEARVYLEQLDRMRPPSPFWHTVNWAMLHDAEGDVRRAAWIIEGIEDAICSPLERSMKHSMLALLATQSGDRRAAVKYLSYGAFAGATTVGFQPGLNEFRIASNRALAFWGLQNGAKCRDEAATALEHATSPRSRAIALMLAEVARSSPADESAVRRLAERFRELDAFPFAAYVQRLSDVARRVPVLSAAEIAVLAEFAATGGTASDVARRLGKATYTVQSQLRAATRKLRCSGRAQAIQIAKKNGWI